MSVLVNYQVPSLEYKLGVQRDRVGLGFFTVSQVRSSVIEIEDTC